MFEFRKDLFMYTPHTEETSRAAREAFEAQHPILGVIDWRAFAKEVGCTLTPEQEAWLNAPKTGKELP